MWWYQPRQITSSDLKFMADYKDGMKAALEQIGTNLIADAKDIPPSDLKTTMEDLGAAILPLAKPWNKFMLKLFDFSMHGHHLRPGQQIATEAEMKEFEALFTGELKDEAAVLFNGVKDVSGLLHLTLLAVADKLEALSDKMKDLQPEDVLRTVYNPQNILVMPEEEEENLLEEDAWVLVKDEVW